MNHKQYLLDLLDGSSSLSHEGIGLVLDRLNNLEVVVNAAKAVRQEINEHGELLGGRSAYGTLEDALAALEGDK